MNHVNKYLRNFKQYKLASHKVWLVSNEERKQMLKLDWNESTIQPSPLVKKKLKELVDDGSFFNLYPATRNEKLYELLSTYCQVPKECIQYFGSSDSLHEYISKLFINVGDPVIILWPSYDNFRLTAEVNGGFVFYYEYNSDFTFDSEGFENFIAEKSASLVYICNPNNPTGYLHTVDYIEKLIKRFPETMFLIDEAYYEFTEPKTSCSQLALKYENILVTRTMSKAFGIANFRFGYLIANEKNIAYISSIRNPKNITTFAQTAAEAVLEDVPYMEAYAKAVNEAKHFFVNELRKIPELEAFPSAGNFVMIKCSDYAKKKELFNYLAEKNIFIRNIEQSETIKNCLRISIGTTEQMKVVLKAINNFYGR